MTWRRRQNASTVCVPWPGAVLVAPACDHAVLPWMACAERLVESCPTHVHLAREILFVYVIPTHEIDCRHHGMADFTTKRNTECRIILDQQAPEAS
jgi:hypothetical protein